MQKVRTGLVFLAMGAAYVLLLIITMDHVIGRLGEFSEPHQKMMLTGSSAILASLFVHLVNRHLLQNGSIPVAVAMAAAAFFYFYVYRPGLGRLEQFPTIFLYGYSAFACAAFVGIPFVVGIALNKSSKKDAVTGASS